MTCRFHALYRVRLILCPCRCTAEENTVRREGAKLSFFKGDGVVKNVPEDKAAVFEVCL
jgi:hypothetical protein